VVIGELTDLDFTASRRLQLAVEQSGVTGFIVRKQTSHPQVNACISRWKITSLPSFNRDQVPGVGFPRWNIELLKIRNGQPGTWQVEWTPGLLRSLPVHDLPVVEIREKKTG
jgi:protein ImuA